MDTTEKPKRRRGRPRKNPESPPAPKRPRGRPRKTPVKQELNEQHVMILLKNHLKDVPGIKIDWDSVNRIHPNKYVWVNPINRVPIYFNSRYIF